MHKVFSFVLFFLLLTGCSVSNSPNQTQQFIGEINLIKNHVLTVDCSDEVNKSDDTYGVGCPVEVTDETVLQEQGGKKLNFTNFSQNEVVEVILTSGRDLVNGDKPFKAAKITKINEIE